MITQSKSTIFGERATGLELAARTVRIGAEGATNSDRAKARRTTDHHVVGKWRFIRAAE